MMIEIEFKEPLYIGGKSLGTYQFPCVPRKGEIVDLGVQTYYDKVINVYYTASKNGVKITVMLGA